MQKADLQPASDANLNHVALDETVIQINGQQLWLYAAVDPDKSLHERLFTTTTTVFTQQILQDLREKHDVEDTIFLVDHAHHLAAVL